MEREPDAETADPGAAPPEAPVPGADPAPRPLVDFSPALHEAGHEVADLGFEGIPDSGPVLHPERDHRGPDDPLDFVNVQIPSD